MMPEAAHLVIFAVESDQGIAAKIRDSLVASGVSLYVVTGDRPLVAMPEWSGPDALLIGLDADLPARLSYARRIQELYPRAAILAYSVAFDAEALAAAMAAGVRRLLSFPLTDSAVLEAITAVRGELDELIGSLDALARLQGDQTDEPAGTSIAGEISKAHKIIVVFSPKGGVGTSTLAVNLATALQVAKHATALVDGNISFGSHDVFLSLPPGRTMLELAAPAQEVTSEVVAETLVRHRCGLSVLLAPLQPEEGDRIRVEHVKHILTLLRRQFTFTVVDTWPGFDDRVLAALELADSILVPFGPDMPAIKNLYSFLRVANLLHYQEERIIPVLMRSDSVEPGYIADIEAFLKHDLRWRVVSDGKRATAAATDGKPFMLSAPDAPISQNIRDIAMFLAGDAVPGEDDDSQNRKLPLVGSRRFWRW
jgi:pilus assembly protein CpaE